MDRLNRIITDKYMSKVCRLDYSEVELASIRYLLEVILCDSEKLLIMLALFASIGKYREFLVCLVSIGALRLFLGGYHMKTFYNCLAFSIIYFMSVVFVVSQIPVTMVGLVLCYLISIAFVIAFAPIQSENRIRYSKEERLRMKLKATGVLVILFMISVASVYLRKYIVAGLLVQQLEIMVVKILEILALRKGGETEYGR